MNVYAIDFSQPDVNPVAKISSFGSILNIVIPVIITFVSLAFLMMLIYGAFMYLTSEGNPEKVKKAQSALVSAVLGLFIVVGAYLITKLISFFFKINLPI